MCVMIYGRYLCTEVCSYSFLASPLAVWKHNKLPPSNRKEMLTLLFFDISNFIMKKTSELNNSLRKLVFCHNFLIK